MNRFLIAALVLLAPFSVLAEGFWNPGVEGQIGGDTVIDPGSGICVQAPTTDVAPSDLAIRPASAWSFGTQDAANLILAGGMDEKFITVGDYTIAAADEVEITVNGVVIATLIEGVDFDCITSNDVCAVNLAIAIEAVSGTSASAVAAKVGIEPDQCGTWGLSTTITDAGGGAFATSDNGTDGVVRIGPIAAMGDIDLNGAYKIIWDADGDTYSYASGDDVYLLFVGGAERFRVTSSLARLNVLLNMNDNSIRNVNDLYQSAAMSSDAEPSPITTLSSKHPFPGIGAINNDGANFYITLASGANDLTGVTRGDTADDTLSFTTIDYDGVSATIVLTENINYTCAAAGSDAECVTNIVAAVNSLAAALGLNAVTADGETTNFYPTVGTVAYLKVVASDPAAVVIVRGTDGVLRVKGALEVAGAANIQGATTLRGDLNVSLNDVVNVNSLRNAAPATDIASNPMRVHSGNAYPYSLTMRPGEALHLSGGVGTERITCVQATAHQTTLTFWVSVDGVFTETTITEDTGTGGDWDCDTDDDTCCAALAAYLDANIAGFTATADANLVWIDPGITTQYIKLLSANGGGGGTAFAASDSPAGEVIIGRTPLRATGAVYFESNIWWTVDDASFIIGSLGSNYTAIQHDTDQTVAAPVTFLNAGSRYWLYAEAANNYLIPKQDNPSVALQSADGAIGKGALFAYDHISSRSRQIDAAPNLFSIRAGNSWAQATGTAQQGGDVWACTGIGTMQIVCDDYADGALDEMVIAIVYGGGLTDTATLIEGTHWDAAVDDETTCDSIGAAIVTYYGAGGFIVPDCDTVGGTCYLQPKHDLCDVDLSITNNADDPFATLVEGDKGDMVLAGNVGIGGTSPSSVLHVKANIAGTVGNNPAGQIIIQNPADDPTSNVVITAYESDGNGDPDQQLWYLGSSSTGNQNITFLNRRNADLTLGTNDTTRITIAADGSVTIAGDVSIEGALTVAGYTRHHDMQIGSAVTGPTAPTFVTIGTFRCAEFDNINETISMTVEIPSEWDGVSDMALELDIFTEASDALANGEIIEFDVSYRSIAAGEAYDDGTAVMINPTVTGGVSETEKGQYHLSATIAYTGGNQPLTIEDNLGFTVNRDVGDSDSYSGAVYVCQVELEYTAVRLGSH